VDAAVIGAVVDVVVVPSDWDDRGVVFDDDGAVSGGLTAGAELVLLESGGVLAVHCANNVKSAVFP
jgi:hypothetical protein